MWYVGVDVPRIEVAQEVEHKGNKPGRVAEVKAEGMDRSECEQIYPTQQSRFQIVRVDDRTPK